MGSSAGEGAFSVRWILRNVVENELNMLKNSSYAKIGSFFLKLCNAATLQVKYLRKNTVKANILTELAKWENIYSQNMINPVWRDVSF